MTTIDQILFHLNAIIISRYIFIFHMKNPLAFQEMFWRRFLFMWIIMISYVIQVTAWATPGRRNLVFYTCSGMDPTVDNLKGLHILSIDFKMIFTIFIYCVVGVKIFLYKKKFLSEKLLRKAILELTPSVLSGFIFVINILLIKLALSYSKFILDGSSKNKLFLEYGFRFVWPHICIGSLILIYVGRNPALKRHLKNNIFVKKDTKYFDLIY